MSDRYFAKIVKVLDEYKVVINKGSSDNVKLNDIFTIIGIDEEIKDPDTNEVLERLEIPKGRVIVKHVQNRIATLESYDYEVSEDRREVKKVREELDTKNILAKSLQTFHFGNDNSKTTVTETITPGEKVKMELDYPEVGDYIIRR